jgi:hypothetical protein
MLFGPENGEQFGNPAVDRSEAMEPGVTGGADGDQDFRVAEPGMLVVNVEVLVPRPQLRH